MGMYTEVFVNCCVKDGDAVPVLKYMLGVSQEVPTLPDHALFQTTRWRTMLRCSSFCFVPRNVSLFEYEDIGEVWCLISLSSFKNYDGEVVLFFDWLRPYVDSVYPEPIGYSRYEEDDTPTIHYSESDT